MRVVVIGAGTIGTAIGRALTPRHQVIPVSRHGEHTVDLEDPASTKNPGQRGEPTLGDRDAPGARDAARRRTAGRHSGSGLYPESRGHPDRGCSRAGRRLVAPRRCCLTHA